MGRDKSARHVIGRNGGADECVELKIAKRNRVCK